MELHDFDESTLDSAKIIVRERFGERACSLLSRYLQNPLRKVCHSVGDIVSRDGVPMAFQAANPRWLYLRKEKILGTNGSLFCKMPGAKLKEVLTVFLRTIGNRAGRKIYFGNTAIPVSGGVGVASNMSIGPTSCEKVRFGIIRLGSFLNFMLRGHLPRFFVNIIDAIWLCGVSVLGKMKIDGHIKQVTSLDEIDIDGFWTRYVERNNGLVCSRTKEELLWVFGDNLRQGNVCMFAYIAEDSLLGYIAIKCQRIQTRCRWMVVDWIAIDDNPSVLSRLLEAVQGFLRTVPGAAFVELIGYPMFIQDVVKKSFPFCRKAPGNSFNYLIDDESFGREFAAVRDISWFFGAYDGDRCM